MSLLGRLWYGKASYAADDNPYRAKLGHVTVEAVKTFNALLNTFSKTFDFRYDEAMRVDPQFALKMRRDPFYRALLQERLMPLTRWKWHIRPEDPTHKEEQDRAKWYEEVIKATPLWSKQQLYLGHATWFGRFGSQFALIKDRIQGKEAFRVGRHIPVNGDKLVFDWDGTTPGVRINQQSTGDYPKENITYDNRGGPILMLRDPQHRSQFIIQVHELDDADYFEPEMAGRVCGVGLRDFVYHGAFLRSKMIQWAVAFMEKVGTLGLLIFRYPEGNAQAKAQAEQSAKDANNRNALAIPMPKGADKATSSAELLPANMTGVQFLVDIISGWWEKHSERLFVGQSATGSTDDEGGLGGTGRAELAKDTKFNLLQFDARGQQESFTSDLLPTLFDHNGDSGWKARFEYALPDPEAESKLNAITKAAALPGKKLEYKADEVRELVGLSRPGPDDEVVGGDEPKPGDTEDPSSGVLPAPPDENTGGAGDNADILDLLFGGSDASASAHATASYDWQPHQIQQGPRKGRSAFINPKTGEIRDTKPKERDGDNPDPATGDPRGRADSDTATQNSPHEDEARAHAKGLLSRVVAVPRAVKEKVSGFVSAKYRKFAERYGATGAKLIMAGAVLLTPVPLPGTSLIPVALAEGVLRLRRALKGNGSQSTAGYQHDQGQAPVPDDLARAAVDFLHDLYEEMGEECPDFDPEALRRVLTNLGHHTSPDAPEEGSTDPHPESEALVLAMTKAAEEGDEQALDDLAELSQDPDALRDLLADMNAGEPRGSGLPRAPCNDPLWLDRGCESRRWREGSRQRPTHRQDAVR
jgi:hypothetical protein